jgi:23S rRNA (adenine2503-C2)-methyltransferase
MQGGRQAPDATAAKEGSRMMEILDSRGDSNLAEIFVARMRDDPLSVVEFVDAVDPRYPRQEKWVVTVSTQFGCPVKCLICDSGGYFRGNLTADEMLSEIDYVVRRRQPDRRITNGKFKIHFARMGEPAFNPAVLEVLERLPAVYDAPGIIPGIPTIAPAGTEEWFERLLAIKQRLYRNGHFQLQLSINSTDPATRDVMMPVRKWSLGQLADYGRRFYEPGDRKLVLNFALARGVAVDAAEIRRIFNPETFIVKLTPVNPTDTAVRNGYETILSGAEPDRAGELVSALEAAGFECIISIGDDREIAIGSNCGQAASVVLKKEALGRTGPRKDGLPASTP